jgi:lysophospholipase L1-like esterase
MTPKTGVLAFLAVVGGGGVVPPPDRFARWEKEVAGIEKRLADKPPPRRAVVFAGSSSIRLWDVAKSFPGRAVVNCGFGGSEIRDNTHFAPRLVVPLDPMAIVFYAGDNDLANGRTPEQVRDDFRAFADRVHAALPKARLLFVAVKPSPKRWALFDAQTRANALVRDLCAGDDRLAFVDVVPAMLGRDGKPIPGLFAQDGLHLSPKGYEIWTAAVAKALGSDSGSGQ